MIVPLVCEADWKARLDGLSAWRPPMARTLVVVPHPDDETLAAGGLIASLRADGVAVTVVAVTDGEAAYGVDPALGELREREQTEALAELGVGAEAVVRLRLPDSGVTDYEAQLTAKLMAMVDKGTHVIAPWVGDFHPDHEACGRAAEAVAKSKGAELTFYFFWTWHRGTVELLEGMELVKFSLNERTAAAKGEALLRHTSQLEHESGEPILPDSLLGPARRPYEVFLLS